jgi:hypothetical protein
LLRSSQAASIAARCITVQSTTSKKKAGTERYEVASKECFVCDVNGRIPSVMWGTLCELVHADVARAITKAMDRVIDSKAQHPKEGPSAGDSGMQARVFDGTEEFDKERCFLLVFQMSESEQKALAKLQVRLVGLESG